ncbi:MAG: hypothetical protein AAGD07_18690 [Planctomycetota bacterium]
MPLRKIWNSLCGRRVPNASSSTVSSENQASPPQTSQAGKSVKANSDTTPGRGVLSMARRAVGRQRGPYAALLRHISDRRPAQILELGVGDGSRAAAILADAASEAEFTYIVVDQFEMAGGAVSLRDFHAKVAAESAQRRPVVIPQSIMVGLESVANRFGYIDLILVSDPDDLEEAAGVLPRIVGENTAVLIWRGEDWDSLDEIATSRRAA